MRNEKLEKLEEIGDETDLAFDSAIKRQCDQIDCKADGCWRPVLLVVPGRDYQGRPMRFPLGIVVCGQHRETRHDALVTDELWQDICQGFEARKVALPYRPGTRLEYVPHGESKELV